MQEFLRLSDRENRLQSSAPRARKCKSLGQRPRLRDLWKSKALKARNQMKGKDSQWLNLYRPFPIHLVFSTKNREPFITPEVEKELHPYMAKIFRELKSPSLAIDGTSDHLHILFSLGRVIKVADLVQEVKTDSSK